MSPLVLPTIVTGVALLQFYYLIDMDAPMTGLLIGHVLITIPYVMPHRGRRAGRVGPGDRGGGRAVSAPAVCVFC